jgi:SWI/SNF-related matrix-associated actin-dependent regulator of chromatin subfamily A3
VAAALLGRLLLVSRASPGNMIADRTSLSFKHVITGAKSSEMEDVAGGVLADDMGLGKTLSMLAAIVASHGQALESAYTRTRAATQYWLDITPSKGTLVIVPSARKFENVSYR